MIKKVFFVVVFLLGIKLGLKAQSYLRTDCGVKTIIDSVVVEIQFYDPSIVRIIKSPEEAFFDKNSLSVIRLPQKPELSVRQKGHQLFFLGI